MGNETMKENLKKETGISEFFWFIATLLFIWFFVRPILILGFYHIVPRFSDYFVVQYDIPPFKQVELWYQGKRYGIFPPGTTYTIQIPSADDPLKTMHFELKTINFGTTKFTCQDKLGCTYKEQFAQKSSTPLAKD